MVHGEGYMILGSWLRIQGIGGENDESQNRKMSERVHRGSWLMING